MSKKMVCADNFRSVKPLPCGCVRGYVSCPEALKLWAAVTYAYDCKSWDEYNKALKEYNEHNEKADSETT